MDYFKDRNSEIEDGQGLSCPSQAFLEFMLFAFCFFDKTKEVMCRVRLVSVLSKFSSNFHLDIFVPLKALQCVANILLKKLVSLALQFHQAFFIYN